MQDKFIERLLIVQEKIELNSSQVTENDQCNYLLECANEINIENINYFTARKKRANTAGLIKVALAIGITLVYKADNIVANAICGFLYGSSFVNLWQSFFAGKNNRIYFKQLDYVDKKISENNKQTEFLNGNLSELNAYKEKLFKEYITKTNQLDTKNKTLALDQLQKLKDLTFNDLINFNYINYFNQDSNVVDKSNIQLEPGE